MLQEFLLNVKSVRSAYLLWALMHNMSFATKLSAPSAYASVCRATQLHFKGKQAIRMLRY